MACPSCLAANQDDARFCFACGAPLEASLAGLASGALFAGRYEIQGPLGRGGMGIVYRARDGELGETVALKVLRPDVARESNGRVEQRFRSEIRLARRVRHRNVCSVYGDGEDQGLLYICMELVDGENLARPVRENGGLPAEEAWDASLQIARGIEAIHQVGIVHRDLKTANLMRDRTGLVRVMDFGIAKQQHPDEGAVTVTATGAVMGTPEYMSPEQLRGDAVDFRSDLYSLAIVIHELFTGVLPFRGDSPVAVIVRHLEEPPALDAARVPPALRAVLERGLCKRPEGRYRTATEMREALEAARLAPEETAPSIPAPPSAGAAAGSASPDGAVRAWRLLAALLAVAALATHLVRAGGPTRPGYARVSGGEAASPGGGDPPATTDPASEPAPPPPEEPAAMRVRPRPAPSPSAVASLPQRAIAVAALPAGEPPAAPVPLRLAPGVDLARVYEEDEVDVKPRRLDRGVTTGYPEWAPDLKRGRQVSITASYVVTESGDVTDIHVEEGEGFLEAVLLEVSRWKYEPGRKSGVPVKVRLRWRHTYVG